MLPKQALYQLSYTEFSLKILRLSSARVAGQASPGFLCAYDLSRTQCITTVVLGWPSNAQQNSPAKSSQDFIHEWSGQSGSNRRHRRWKRRALPTELCPLNVMRTNPSRAGVASQQIVKDQRCKPFGAWCAARSLHNTNMKKPTKKPGACGIRALLVEQLVRVKRHPQMAN